MAYRLVSFITGDLAEGEEPKVLQLVGFPPGVMDSEDHQERLPWPRVLIIEEDSEGYYSLYRYTESGEFGGDTWHMTLDDAKHQAEYEFAERLGPWREVPEDSENAIAFALQELEAR